MTIRTTLITTGLIAASLVSGIAHAALHDRGGGLIYDDNLNITWLQNANYGAGSIYDNADPYFGNTATDGLMSWQNAVDWTANLSYYDNVRGVTYTDWRLPTVNPVNGFDYTPRDADGLVNGAWTSDGSTDYGFNITSTQSELSYMFYVNLGNPGSFTPSGALSGCNAASSYCLNNTGPFINLLPRSYWAGPLFSRIPNSNPTDVWNFYMYNGYQTFGGISFEPNFAWAVRDGDVAAVPEAETYALMLAGLGLIGWRARRRG